ncbi:MAG: hypothetical protein ABJ246_19415 [Paracoccaceae bacterium]
MSLWRSITYPFRRQPRGPLASRRPDRAKLGQTRDVPLGMEEIDLDLVKTVARKNDALEKTNMASERNGGFLTGHRNTYVAPMPEDESYAARFHRAFNKKGTP